MLLTAAYKKYCTGLKKADCVLVNKSRNTNCDFMKFISEPPVPRKRPDLTTFIHRPLQHFRELLKLMQLIASYCRIDTEEYNNLQFVISEIQVLMSKLCVDSRIDLCNNQISVCISGNYNYCRTYGAIM